jgi:hypothetical protein
MSRRIYDRLKNGWNISGLALSAFNRIWQSAEGECTVKGQDPEFAGEGKKQMMRRLIKQWRDGQAELDAGFCEIEKRFKL